MKRIAQAHRYNLRHSRKNLENNTPEAEPARSAKTNLKCRFDEESSETEFILNALKQISSRDPAHVILSDFHRLVENHFDWMGWRLQPFTETGAALLQNGHFIVKWCEILLKNASTDQQELLESVEVEMLKQVSTNKAQLIRYLNKNRTRGRSTPKQLKAKKCQSKKVVLRTASRGTQTCNGTYRHRIVCSSKELKITVDTEESQSHPAGVRPPTDYFQLPDRFYEEILSELSVKRLIDLRSVLIEGVLEYDYACQGLYSVLLVHDKSPTKLNSEYLAVLPIQHDSNDQSVLRSLSEKYDIQAVVCSKEAVSNVKLYWQNHLDEFFAE